MNDVGDNVDDQDETMESDKDDSDSGSNDSDDSDAFCSSDASCGEIERTIEAATAASNMYEDHFYALRDAYKIEKLAALDFQLQEIDKETSPDYLQPVEELTENKNERIEVAGIMRNYRIQNEKLHFEAELAISEQDFENRKRLLKESMREELEEKIRKLNEDRRKADTDFYNDAYMTNRARRYSGPYTDADIVEKKRPKPVQVSGPYIVFMLKDEEIMEDLNFIRCFSRPAKSYSSYHNY